jgi:hypothetical protein
VFILKKDGKWYLPESEWTQDPETIRQAAERALKEDAPTVEASFTGQAPIAHLENPDSKV